MRSTARSVLLALAVLGCTGRGGGESSDDPHRPGLAFAKVPTAVNVNGRFEVWARINDQLGELTGDSETVVTIHANGGGTLHGTLSRRVVEGRVYFDDLVYDRWESISLTLAASELGEVTTAAALPVRPLMRFVKAPPDQVPTSQPVGPFEIELVDGRGQPVDAAQPVALESGDEVEAAGGPTRTFAQGQVRYDQIVLRAAGAWTLVWRSPGLNDLVQPIRVHGGQDTQSLWLPAARVGVPYRAALPSDGADFRLLDGDLPRGLTLEASGELHGVPTSAGHVRLPIYAARPMGTSVLYRTDLSVFPEAETSTTTLDALDTDGPFAVGTLDDTVMVASRKTSVRVRVFYPRRDGAPAPGVFPLVVFHHGAVVTQPDHPSIYDRFDPLLRRWTSHGYVVATIDAPELVWVEGRLVAGTLNNLNAMSEDQRATIAYFKQRVGDPSFPLGGHVDVDRVIAAGHSRGGGASLITARAEPSVVGGILIKPLDPLGTTGGEAVWNGPLPAKPFLLVIAGADADLPYPMVDFLYERRAGPMVAPTITGSLHNWSCDASCPPEDDGVAGIPREEDWAVTNAYAVAFLSYVARGDLTTAPLLFGREGLTTHLAGEGTLVRSDRSAAALLVDDFQAQTPGRNRLGLPGSDHQMAWSADEPSLITALRALPDPYASYRTLYERPELLAESTAHRLQWTADGASYATALGGLDVKGFASFLFRARTDQEPLPPDRFAVRFRDTAGATALVAAAGHCNEAGLGARFSDVIVPLSEVAAAGVDLGLLDSVELVFRGAGSVLVDDLRFE
jgi:dienelactone hydrolase